jgi:hypothetical protein
VAGPRQVRWIAVAVEAGRKLVRWTAVAAVEVLQVEAETAWAIEMYQEHQVPVAPSEALRVARVGEMLVPVVHEVLPAWEAEVEVEGEVEVEAEAVEVVAAGEGGNRNYERG